MELSKQEFLKEMTTGLHKKTFREAIDECVNKTLDYESSRTLIKIFELSLDQVVGAYIKAIIKIKQKMEEKQNE